MKHVSTHTEKLKEVLDTNKQVAEEVQTASEDLSVVHAVLQQEVPKGVSHGDVQEAIDRTHEIEEKLAESADRLDEANKALEQAITSQAGSAR